MDVGLRGIVVTTQVCHDNIKALSSLVKCVYYTSKSSV